MTDNAVFALPSRRLVQIGSLTFLCSPKHFAACNGCPGELRERSAVSLWIGASHNLLSSVRGLERVLQSRLTVLARHDCGYALGPTHVAEHVAKGLKRNAVVLLLESGACIFDDDHESNPCYADAAYFSANSRIQRSINSVNESMSTSTSRW